MYMTMFYVGIIMAFMGVVSGLIFFIKDNIIECIRTLLGLFLLLIICIFAVIKPNDVAYSKTLGEGIGNNIGFANNTEDTGTANDAEKTKSGSDDNKTTGDAEKGKSEKEDAKNDGKEDAKDDEKGEDRNDGNDTRAGIEITEIRYTDRDYNTIELTKEQRTAEQENEDQNNEEHEIEEQGSGQESEYGSEQGMVYCDSVKGIRLLIKVAFDKDNAVSTEELHRGINVYIKIPDNEVKHMAARHIDDKYIEDDGYWYTIELFTEEWGELEEDTYDGILTIVAENKNGDMAELNTVHIQYKKVQNDDGNGSGQNDNEEKEVKEQHVDKAEPEIIMYSNRRSDKWSKEDLVIYTYITDEDSGLKRVTYYIDGDKRKEISFDNAERSYNNQLTVKKSADRPSGYYVEVEAIDCSGNVSKKKCKVCIDKNSPKAVISGAATDKHYSSDVEISIKLTDVSYREAYAEYHIRRTLDDRTYIYKRDRFEPHNNNDTDSFTLSEEGAYSVYALAVDGAGNTTRTQTLNFVIDKTMPRLSITGVRDGSVSNRMVILTFGCVESFYGTNEVRVNVRKTQDRKVVSNELNIFNRTGKQETEVHEFSEDGRYVVEMSAVDKAGNAADRIVLSFTIDCTAPEINIVGTDAYQQWGEDVDIRFVIREINYTRMKVKLKGYRRDIIGNRHEIVFTGTKKRARVTRWIESFKEDGIYSLSVSAVDEAGNYVEKKINFVIDKTAPEIKGLDDYNGKYLKGFCLKDVVNHMFTDLTMLSCKMLLNGIEYDGVSEIIREGRYTLYVDAVDELGHRSTRTCDFIIDRTPPIIIFDGVTDGGIVYQKGQISIRTDNPDDFITRIAVNGKEVSEKLRKLSYNEYGDYNIEIESEDLAGNVGHQELTFTYKAQRKGTPAKNGSAREKLSPQQTEVNDSAHIIVVVVFVLICTVICTVLRVKTGSVKH